MSLAGEFGPRTSAAASKAACSRMRCITGRRGAGSSSSSRGPNSCGNHTWSFHESDIPQQARVWFDPLAAHRWPGYVVRFPGMSRRVGIPYATVTSDGLREATPPAAEAESQTGRAALVIRSGEACEIAAPTCVRLGDGSQLEAATVSTTGGRAASPGPPREARDTSHSSGMSFGPVGALARGGADGDGRPGRPGLRLRVSLRTSVRPRSRALGIHPLQRGAQLRRIAGGGR